MAVRAKFEVLNVEPFNEGAKITLQAVYDPDPASENGRFFKYTPSGSISLSTVNPDAASQFKPGDKFYVDFHKAE